MLQDLYMKQQICIIIDSTIVTLYTYSLRDVMSVLFKAIVTIKRKRMLFVDSVIPGVALGLQHQHFFCRVSKKSRRISWKVAIHSPAGFDLSTYTDMRDLLAYTMNLVYAHQRVWHQIYSHTPAQHVHRLMSLPDNKTTQFVDEQNALILGKCESYVQFLHTFLGEPHFSFPFFLHHWSLVKADDECK